MSAFTSDVTPLSGSAFGRYATHHTMKTCIASVIFLLVGLAIGFYIGYRDYHKHIADEAVQQLVESGESSDALMAAMSANAISLIDSGQDQNAIHLLSYPIGRYYYIYASSTFTNEQRLRLRAMIDALASSNHVVAAVIAEEMSNKRGDKK